LKHKQTKKEKFFEKDENKQLFIYLSHNIIDLFLNLNLILLI